MILIVVARYWKAVVRNPIDGSIMRMVRWATAMVNGIMLWRIMLCFGGGSDTQGPARRISVVVR